MIDPISAPPTPDEVMVPCSHEYLFTMFQKSTPEYVSSSSCVSTKLVAPMS